MHYFAHDLDRTLERSAGTGVAKNVANRWDYRSKRAKKTRQGNSKNTKRGTKVSKKYYKKKYRGQGKRR